MLVSGWPNNVNCAVGTVFLIGIQVIVLTESSVEYAENLVLSPVCPCLTLWFCSIVDTSYSVNSCFSEHNDFARIYSVIRTTKT